MATTTPTTTRRWRDLYQSIKRLTTSDGGGQRFEEEFQLVEESFADLSTPLNKCPPLPFAASLPSSPSSSFQLSDEDLRVGASTLTSHLQDFFKITDTSNLMKLAQPKDEESYKEFLQDVHGSFWANWKSPGQQAPLQDKFTQVLCLILNERRCLLTCLSLLFKTDEDQFVDSGKSSLLGDLKNRLVESNLVSHLCQSINATSERLNLLLTSPSHREALRAQIQIAALIWERRALSELVFLIAHSGPGALACSSVDALARSFGFASELKHQFGASSSSSVSTAIMIAPTGRLLEWSLLEKSQSLDVLYFLYFALCAALSRQPNQRGVWTDDWISKFEATYVLLGNGEFEEVAADALTATAQTSSPWFHDGVHGAVTLAWGLFRFTFSDFTAHDVLRTCLERAFDLGALQFLRCLQTCSEFKRELDTKVFLLEILNDVLLQGCMDWVVRQNAERGTLNRSNYLDEMQGRGVYRDFYENRNRVNNENDEEEDALRSAVDLLLVSRKQRVAVVEQTNTNIIVNKQQQLQEFPDALEDLTECLALSIEAAALLASSQRLDSVAYFQGQTPQNRFLLHCEKHCDRKAFFHFTTALIKCGSFEVVPHAWQYLQASSFVRDTAQGMRAFFQYCRDGEAGGNNVIIPVGVGGGGGGSTIRTSSLMESDEIIARLKVLVAAWDAFKSASSSATSNSTAGDAIVNSLANELDFVWISFGLIAFQIDGLEKLKTQILKTMAALLNHNNNDSVLRLNPRQHEQIVETWKRAVLGSLPQIQQYQKITATTITTTTPWLTAWHAPSQRHVEQRLDLHLHLNEIEATHHHTYTTTCAVLDLTASLVRDANADPALESLLRFIMEEVFLRFDQRAYSHPGEKWIVANKCLGVFLSACESCEDKPGAGYWIMEHFFRGNALFEKLMAVLSACGGGFGSGAGGLEEALLVAKRNPSLDPQYHRKVAATRGGAGGGSGGTNGTGTFTSHRPDWTLAFKRRATAIKKSTRSKENAPPLQQTFSAYSNNTAYNAPWSTRQAAAAAPAAVHVHRYVGLDHDDSVREENVMPSSYGLLHTAMQVKNSSDGESRMFSTKCVAEWLARYDSDAVEDYPFLWHDGDANLENRTNSAKTALLLLREFATREAKLLQWNRSRAAIYPMMRFHALVLSKSEVYVDLIAGFVGFRPDESMRVLALGIIDYVSKNAQDPNEQVFCWTKSKYFTYSLRDGSKLEKANMFDFLITRRPKSLLRDSVGLLESIIEQNSEYSKNCADAIRALCLVGGSRGDLPERLLKRFLNVYGLVASSRSAANELLAGLSWTMQLIVNSVSSSSFFFFRSRNHPTYCERVLDVFTNELAMSAAADSLNRLIECWRRLVEENLVRLDAPVPLILQCLTVLGESQCPRDAAVSLSKTSSLLMKLYFTMPSKSPSVREEVFALAQKTAQATASLSHTRLENLEAWTYCVSCLLMSTMEPTRGVKALSALGTSFFDGLLGVNRVEFLLDAFSSACVDESSPALLRSTAATAFGTLLSNSMAERKSWIERASRRGLFQAFFGSSLDRAFEREADESFEPMMAALECVSSFKDGARVLIEGGGGLNALTSRPVSLLADKRNFPGVQQPGDPAAERKRSDVVLPLLRFVATLSASNVRFGVRFLKSQPDLVRTSLSNMKSQFDVEEAFLVVSLLSTCAKDWDVLAVEISVQSQASMADSVFYALCESVYRLSNPPSGFASSALERNLVRACLSYLTRAAAGVAIVPRSSAAPRRREEIETLVYCVELFATDKVQLDVERSLVLLWGRLNDGASDSQLDILVLKKLFPTTLVLPIGGGTPSSLIRPSGLELFLAGSTVRVTNEFSSRICIKLKEIRFRGEGGGNQSVNM